MNTLPLAGRVGEGVKSSKVPELQKPMKVFYPNRLHAKVRLLEGKLLL
jgi:hypothetical protein